MIRLQLIHSDVCNPISTESIGGNRYFVTFYGDYSRCCTVCFLKIAAEVPCKFKLFERCVANNSSQSIVPIWSNNGGENWPPKVESSFESKGIYYELAVPYSPEQNGVAKRMNKTLLESARSMTVQAGLPNKFWAEAMKCAA